MSYKSIFKNENVEIYEYQHYNQIEKEHSVCACCNPSKNSELIAEMLSCYAILENENQATIIPKRHVASYFDLTTREQTACNLMLNFVKNEMERRFLYHNFEIKISVNEVVEHCVLEVFMK